MDFDALLDQGDGKSRGVGALAFAGLDGFVGDEPSISAATKILSFCVTPAGDVGFIDIRHTCGAAVELDVAGFGEVKNVFVAVVDITLGIDRFEMPSGNWLATNRSHGDRFDPVKGVLQNKQGLESIGQSEDELMGEKGVGWRGTDVEEKRRVILHDALHFGCPCFAPSDEFIAWRGVFEGRIVDPEIVRRRGHHEIEGFLFERGEGFQAITM